MPTNWEEYNNQKNEISGKNDASSVNEKENALGKWGVYNQERVDKYRASLFKKKREIDYSNLDWFETADKGIRNAKLTRYFGLIPEGIKGMLLLGYTGAGALANYKVTAKELSEWAGAVNTVGTDIFNEKNRKKIKPLYEKNKKVIDYLTFADSMSKEYGTEEGWKRQIVENPEETIVFFGTLVSGILGVAAKVGGIAGKVASAASKVTAMSDPWNMARQAMRTPMSIATKTANGLKDKSKIAAKVSNVPVNLYERGLGLSNELPVEAQTAIAKELMNNNIVLDMNGLKDIHTIIEDLGKTLDKTITGMSQDKIVSVNELKLGFNELEKKLAGETILFDVREGKEAIEKLLDKNLKEIAGKTELGPVELQKLKVKTGYDLTKYFKDMSEGVMSSAIKKEFAAKIRSNVQIVLEHAVPETSLLRFKKITREHLKAAFPDKTKEVGAVTVKQINQLNGSLKAVVDTISDVAQNQKKGPFVSFAVGQKMATFAVGGAVVSKFLNFSENVAAAVTSGSGALGIATGILDSSPAIKSKVAIYLNNLRDIGIKPKTTSALIRLGFYEYGDNDHGWPTSRDMGVQQDP